MKTQQKQTKLQKVKEAITNPPAERLAKIEYQSNIFQIIGISFACLILVLKGFWYIIFAFMFGIGISYSQAVNAYQRYKILMSYKEPEKLSDYEKDISPTRRRSKIIYSVMKGWAKWISIIFSVVISVLIIDPTNSKWILMVNYIFSIIVIFIFIYFFMFYYICYPIYKKRLKLKGGKK